METPWLLWNLGWIFILKISYQLGIQGTWGPAAECTSLAGRWQALPCQQCCCIPVSEVCSPLLFSSHGDMQHPPTGHSVSETKSGYAKKVERYDPLPRSLPIASRAEAVKSWCVVWHVSGPGRTEPQGWQQSTGMFSVLTLARRMKLCWSIKCSHSWALQLLGLGGSWLAEMFASLLGPPL